MGRKIILDFFFVAFSPGGGGECVPVSNINMCGCEYVFRNRQISVWKTCNKPTLDMFNVHYRACLATSERHPFEKKKRSFDVMLYHTNAFSSFRHPSHWKCTDESNYSTSHTPTHNNKWFFNDIHKFEQAILQYTSNTLTRIQYIISVFHTYRVYSHLNNSRFGILNDVRKICCGKMCASSSTEYTQIYVYLFGVDLDGY